MKSAGLRAMRYALNVGVLHRELVFVGVASNRRATALRVNTWSFLQEKKSNSALSRNPHS